MTPTAGLATDTRPLFASWNLVRARMAQNTFWALLGSGFSQGASLLVALMLGRMLGLAGFGQLALIQATILMLGNLGEGGLSLTTTKFVSRCGTSDPGRAGQVMRLALRVTAASSVLMVGLLFVIEPYIGGFGPASAPMGFMAVCGLLIFDMLNRVQFGALAGFEAFEDTARIHFWRGLLILPCVWLGTVYAGLPGAIQAMALVGLITFLMGHRMLRRQCRARSISPGYGTSFDRGILTTSVSLWISLLLLTGSTWVVTILLSRSVGLEELGLFNAAERWKTVLLFVPNVLFQVVLPMLSRNHAAGDRGGCSRIISAALASTGVVALVGALLVIALAPLLMSGYGESFRMGAGVLSLAAAGAVVGALYTVGGGILWALGKPTRMLGIDLVRTLLLLGLCLAGFASSAWDVTMANLLSLSGGCVLVMASVRTHLRINRDDETT